MRQKCGYARRPSRSLARVWGFAMDRVKLALIVGAIVVSIAGALLLHEWPTHISRDEATVLLESPELTHVALTRGPEFYIHTTEGYYAAPCEQMMSVNEIIMRRKVYGDRFRVTIE